MILQYKNSKINGKKLKKICEDYGEACQAIGKDKAKSLFNLMRQIAALEEFEDLKTIPYFENLSGDRKMEYSLRITANYRLTLTKIETNEQSVLILNIEDYH
jgi:plasmid maintenance system killer protein